MLDANKVLYIVRECNDHDYISGKIISNMRPFEWHKCKTMKVYVQNGQYGGSFVVDVIDDFTNLISKT